MEIRAFQSGDLAGVLSLLEVAMPADPVSEVRFTRQVLLDGNFAAEGAPVAVEGGMVVGFGGFSIARRAPLENAPSDADRGYLTLMGVWPAWRRNGIGGKLLEWVEDYLRRQGRKVVMVSSYAPGYFIPGVDVGAYGEALGFLGKRGYKEVYRPIAMAAPLWELVTPGWVGEKEAAVRREGITVVPYRAEMTLELLAFVKREFPGDWVRVVRGTMDRILQGEAATRIFVAQRSGGEVVGFSHHEVERFGPIGTAAAVRGKGLGQVLMYKTLQAQRAAGLRTAWFLWSDDKTAARIYSAAGFREVRRFALMKKEI